MRVDGIIGAGSGRAGGDAGETVAITPCGTVSYEIKVSGLLAIFPTCRRVVHKNLRKFSLLFGSGMSQKWRIPAFERYGAPRRIDITNIGYAVLRFGGAPPAAPAKHNPAPMFDTDT